MESSLQVDHGTVLPEYPTAIYSCMEATHIMENLSVSIITFHTVHQYNLYTVLKQTHSLMLELYIIYITLYQFFGHTIHTVSLILVTQYFKQYILLKFRVFWSLKFQTSHEICGYIKVFWSKTRQNVC